MRLTEKSDHALRTLMLLASAPGRRTVPAMAAALDVSAHHLAKVVQDLHAPGWVATSRGRGGGVELAVDPRELTIGRVVRQIESDFGIAECFRPGSTCPLDNKCGLAEVLDQATDAFLQTLDRVTLDDVSRVHRTQLIKLGKPQTGA